MQTIVGMPFHGKEAVMGLFLDLLQLSDFFTNRQKRPPADNRRFRSRGRLPTHAPNRAIITKSRQAIHTVLPAVPFFTGWKWASGHRWPPAQT